MQRHFAGKFWRVLRSVAVVCSIFSGRPRAQAFGSVFSQPVASLVPEESGNRGRKQTSGPVNRADTVQEDKVVHFVAHFYTGMYICINLIE